jgi:hypothetical protein
MTQLYQYKLKIKAPFAHNCVITFGARGTFVIKEQNENPDNTHTILGR